MRARFPRLFADSDEDLRPRLVSWSVALGAGAAWLAIVHLSPPVTIRDVARAEPPPIVDFVPGNRVAEDASEVRPKGAISTPRIAGANVAQAFATTIVKKVATDVAALIGGVEAVREITNSVITGEKAALGTGAPPRTTPGAAKFGNDAAARGEVGTVAHGAGVTRAEVKLKPLSVVAPPLARDVAIDATEAAAFVRARAAQLQYCYARTAGAESDLAGVVTLRLDLGPNGSVKDAAIVRRTWSGQAAAETEACILALARGWRVERGSEGSTLTLPISFTRNR